MFCRACGKEIRDDAIFCPYCGHKEREKTGKIELNVDFSGIVQKGKQLIDKVGVVKLVNALSVTVGGINLLIRVFSNQVVTEYVALAQDDYYVLTDAGRNWMIVIMVLYAALCGGLLYHENKRGIKINNQSAFTVVGVLVLSIILISLRIPAPY